MRRILIFLREFHTCVQFGTKSKERKIFVIVIELKDLDDRFEGSGVLVSTHVKAVKRVKLLGRVITQSKINSNLEINLAASKYVVKEVMSLLESNVLQQELCIF